MRLDQGDRVLVLSLELSEADWRGRMNGHAEDSCLVVDAAADPDWQRIEHAIRDAKPDLVVLDYLQLLPGITSVTGDDPWTGIEAAAGPHIDVLVLSQLPGVHKPLGKTGLLLGIPLPPVSWRVGFV